ncbi:hypothetical protein SAMN05444157_1551 [Frankineae bacterium MT45]|nr:hypothetical protein SAMN05444157_1551 [Frankineae bacterium MT45]
MTLPVRYQQLMWSGEGAYLIAGRSVFLDPENAKVDASGLVGASERTALVVTGPDTRELSVTILLLPEPAEDPEPRAGRVAAEVTIEVPDTTLEFYNTTSDAPDVELESPGIYLVRVIVDVGDAGASRLANESHTIELTRIGPLRADGAGVRLARPRTILA